MGSIFRLDFGKDKYQFVITKNKGADGKYYKMFMDDTLQINPAQLSGSIENQMNLFTMEHEENYGDMMNELIGIFIPPENATHEELEEAKKNMDKYADLENKVILEVLDRCLCLFIRCLPVGFQIITRQAFQKLLINLIIFFYH